MNLLTGLKKLTFSCGLATSIVFNFSCSSSKKEPSPPRSQKGEIILPGILLYNLHFRRPEQIGASFNAIPGEEDYKSKSPSDARYNCQPLKELYEGIDLQAARECLQNSTQSASLRNTPELRYRLFRDTAPYLALEPPSDSTLSNPECYQKHLSQIPVPREIFFQSKVRGELDCYNSRLDLKSEEFLRIQSTLYRDHLHVPLPIIDPPQSEEDTILFLATWSLTPFLTRKENTVSAKYVSSYICRTCIGTSHLYGQHDKLPPSWPR